MGSLLENVPFIFPPSPSGIEFLEITKSKLKCSVTYFGVVKNDYFGILESLQMDYYSALRALCESNGVPERWLNLKVPGEGNDFGIFNIFIETGYKKANNPSNKQKMEVIYGHQAILVVPLDNKDLGHKKIKKSIKRFLEKKKPKPSIFPSSLQVPDILVKLIVNFDHQHLVPYSQIYSILKDLLQQPPIIIKTTPTKSVSKSTKKRIILAIRAMTTLFQVKNLIERSFKPCAIVDSEPRFPSARVCTSKLTQSTTPLVASIRSRRPEAAASHLKSIYTDILMIQKRMKEKLIKYFEKPRRFPALKFCHDLITQLEIIYHALRYNLTIFKGYWFLQWTPSTIRRLGTMRLEEMGIIVTRDNFPNETFYHRLNNDEIFWAFKFEALKNSEPMLYVNGEEHYFGLIVSRASASSSPYYLTSGLMVDVCQCGAEEVRYWICSNCQALVKRLNRERIICSCEPQAIADVQKQCYRCLVPQTSNQGEDVFEEEITPKNITKILIVQRSKKPNTSSLKSTLTSKVLPEEDTVDPSSFMSSPRISRATENGSFVSQKAVKSKTCSLATFDEAESDSDKTPINNYTSNASKESPKSPRTGLNIIFLGEVEVGKSTLIQAFFNYSKYSNFVEATSATGIDNQASFNSQTFTDNYNSKDSGSNLSSPKTFHLSFNSKVHNLIDTPGISDPRGPIQDEISLSHIKKFIDNLNDELHGICFVINADLHRTLSPQLELSMRRLISLIPAKYLKNICFFFTRSETVEFELEKAMASLKELVDKLRETNGIEIPLGPENCYLAENGSYRWLAAQKQGLQYSGMSMDQMKDGWEKSAQEIHRFLNALDQN